MPNPEYADNYNDRVPAESAGSFRNRLSRVSEKVHPSQSNSVKRQLSSLQKNAPKITTNLAKGKTSALLNFASGLFKQIDISTDWPFIILFSFALLKDIFDIVFAAAGIGTLGIGVAIGIIISFVGDLLFLILTVTTLILVGGKFKQRGVAKYFVSVAMEFIAEALPGISWLPWTVIYVFILYLFVLYDRAYGRQAEEAESEQAENAEQTGNENIPASGTADNYYGDERLAA